MLKLKFYIKKDMFMKRTKISSLSGGMAWTNLRKTLRQKKKKTELLTAAGVFL